MKLIPKYQNAARPLLYNSLYDIPGFGERLRKTATKLGIGASKYFNKKTGEFDLPEVKIIRLKPNAPIEQPDALKFGTDASGNFVRIPSGGSSLTDMRRREYHMKLENHAKLIQEAEKQGLAPVYNEEGDIIDFTTPRLALGRNDRPLSGTDPIGSFAVGWVASNPVFKGLGKAGKWLWGKLGNTASQGVKKVIANDGKILLQLPSHSKKMPRQLRIEPQGDNTYRVHISTWGGVTDAEKKELYDALYNTLPENAKILFPESSADYLATRGTVAGLKRLGRDPRFTPGKTKQTLMYRDKDGSIKTFEGTDFVKSPNYKAWTPEQWTAAQDAAIARGDMIEAQRLRDLHFKVKTPNNKYQGHAYHNTNTQFNEFKPEFMGKTDNGYYGEGFYFTPNKIDANNALGPIQKDVYIYLKNPKEITANNYISGPLRNNDGVIVRNGKEGWITLDGTPPPNPNEVMEVVSNIPSRIKSADAITYDELGRRIPLGLRDNFNIKDIRWGVLPMPFLFGNRK